MSNVVEERVVQMEFDNKDFEKNIEQSRKSLNLFQTGLAALTGATAGIGSFAYQLKGLTFDPINNGIQIGIGKMAQFAAVFTGVSNIANEVYTRITQTVGQLSTLKQFDAGFQKYEEKTSSVQTIMAAVRKEGETDEEVMARVNEQMEKLNWFTDETSYSFTDMVNNIGKFTSQGIELDKSVTAMQGIATWAAKSGAGVQGASRAMYNLSQALGVGAVKLQDWKSIENANMATKEFKEQAMEAAVAVGTLRKENGKYFSGKKEVNVQNFSQTLSTGWFSSDALMKVLETYGAYADLVHDAQEDGELASQTMKRLAEEGENAGYELGESAFKAAQEAKTFTEAIDATKDAMSTSFLNIFETIFGNYLEAKELWTDFAELLYDVFVTPLGAIQKMANSWKQLEGTTKIFRGLEHIVEAIYNVTDKISEQIDKSFKDHDFVRVLGSLATAFEKLGKYLIEVSENIANNEAIWQNVDKFFKGIIDTFSMVQDVVSKIFNKLIKPIFKTLAEEGPSALSDIIGSVGIFLKQMSDLYFSSDVLNTVLENTSEIISFIFKELKDIGAVAKTAFDAIFSKKLNTSEISGLVSPLETLKDILKEFIGFISTGLQNIIPVTVSVFGWIKRIIGQLITFVQKLWPNIKNVFANIKEWFVNLSQSLKTFFDNSKFSNPFETLKNAFTSIIDKIKEFIGNFTKAKEQVNVVNSGEDSNKPNIFQILAAGIGKAIVFIASIAEKYGDQILTIRKILFGDRGIDEVIMNISQSLLSMAESLLITAAVAKVFFGVNGLVSMARTQLFDGKNGLFPMLKDFLSQKLPKVINPFKGMMNDFGAIMDKFSKDIINSFKTMSTQKTIIAVIHELGSALLKLAAAMLIISLIPEDRFVDSFGALIGILGALTAVIAGLFKVLDDSTQKQATSQNGETAGKLAALTGFLIGISASVIVLAGALAIISSIGDWKQALQGLLGIAGILGGLVGIAWSINSVDGKQLIITGLAMLIISKAVQNIAKAVKTIGKIEDKEKALTALGIVGAILGSLVAITLLASMMKADTKSIIGLFAIETLMTTITAIIIAMTGVMLATTKLTDPAKTIDIFKQMIKMMGVLLVFVGTLVALSFSLSKSNMNQILSLGSMAKIITTVLTLATAIKLLATDDMDPEKIKNAAIALSLVMGAMSAVILSSVALAKGGVKGVATLAGTFISISLGLLALVPVLNALSTMDIPQLSLSLLVLVGALGALLGAGALMTIDKTGMIGNNLMKFAGAVLMLGTAALAAGAGVWLIADGFDKITASVVKLTEIGPEGLTKFENAIEVFSNKIPELMGSVGAGFANFFVKLFANRVMIASGIVNVILAFAQGIKQAFPQIKETFELVMDGLLEFLREFMPKVNSFLYDVITDLNQYILDILNRDVPKLNEHLENATWDLFLRILRLLNKGVPMLNQELAMEGMNLVFWVNELLKFLAKTILKGTIDILTMIRDNIGEIIALTVEIANVALFGLIDGMISTVPLLYDKITELIDDLLELFNKILDTDWDKIETSITKLLNNIITLMNKWVTIESKAGGVIYNVGRDLLKGLVKGIINSGALNNNPYYKLGGKVGSLFINGFKSKQSTDINSPSKVMEKMGGFLTEGLSNGIEKGSDKVKTVATDLGGIVKNAFTKNFGTKDEILGNLGNGLLDGLKSTWSGFDFGSLLGGFTNLNPTITPTLDLSTLQSQVGGIDSMFATQQVSAISSFGLDKGVDSVTATNAMNDLVDKMNSYMSVQQYNAASQTPTNVNVTLGGDAKKMLKVLSVENTKQTKATGVNQLVNQFG